MQIDPKSPSGPGCLIFAGFLLGSVLGIAYGEASLGMLIGVGLGILLALALWLASRRKSD